MSYDIQIYFGDDNAFPETQYWQFLEHAKQLHGSWQIEQNSCLDITRKQASLHSACLQAQTHIYIDLTDTSHVDDLNEAEKLRDFAWELSLETGAGRSNIALAVQWLLPILALKTFSGKLAIRDAQSGLKTVVTDTHEHWLTHVNATIQHWGHSLARELQTQKLADDQGRLIIPHNISQRAGRV